MRGIVISLVLTLLFAVARSGVESEIVHSLDDLALTPAERKKMTKLREEYKEAEKQGEVQKNRTILDDWQAVATNSWEPHSYFDEECESCQFIMFEAHTQYMGIKQKLKEKQDARGLFVPPVTTKGILSANLIQMLNNLCRFKFLSAYGKIAAIDAHSVVNQFCGPLLKANFLEIQDLLVEKSKGEKVLRKKICTSYCNKHALKVRNKPLAVGLWKKLVDYPTSSKRHNTPWMRREQQGVAFLDSILLDPAVKAHPQGAYYYKVIESGDPNHKHAKVLQGDTARVHLWSRQMYSEGQVVHDTYNGDDAEPAEVSIPPQALSGLTTGMKEALKNMVKGDNWMLYIPSEYCHSTYGLGHDHPPNVHEMVQMHLVGIDGHNPVDDVMEQYTRHSDFNLQWNFTSPYAKKANKTPANKAKKQKKTKAATKAAKDAKLKNEL